MNVILERYPYRYVEVGELENGRPDFRIQKEDYYTKRYRDMYLCDNGMQLVTAIEEKGFQLAEEWEMDDNTIEITATRWVE